MRPRRFPPRGGEPPIKRRRVNEAGDSAYQRKGRRVCFRWPKGTCTFGDNCRFLHEGPARGPARGGGKDFNLFMRGLDYYMTLGDVKSEILESIKVTGINDVVLPKSRESADQNRGFAILKFDSRVQAENAMKKLGGIECRGRTLHVQWSQSRGRGGGSSRGHYRQRHSQRRIPRPTQRTSPIQSSPNKKPKRNSQRDEDETFECPLCLDDCSKQDVFEISDKCGHVLCRACAHQNFVTDLQARRFPLLCPTCRAENVETEVPQEKLILILSPEEQLKYHSGTLNQFVVTTQNTHQCPVPDCVGIAWLDNDEVEFSCPVCNYRYCVKCETAWHEGQTCRQNSESKSESKFAAIAKEEGWQKCPRCKATVEKTYGCNHMSCRCGKEFCYACGGDYPECDCLPEGLSPRMDPYPPRGYERRPAGGGFAPPPLYRGAPRHGYPNRECYGCGRNYSECDCHSEYNDDDYWSDDDDYWSDDDDYWSDY